MEAALPHDVPPMARHRAPWKRRYTLNRRVGMASSLNGMEESAQDLERRLAEQAQGQPHAKAQGDVDGLGATPVTEMVDLVTRHRPALLNASCVRGVRNELRRIFAASVNASVI